MMSYGFLSNYALSKKDLDLNGMSSDQIIDETASRLEKIQNNELISVLGALISCIGVVIPIDFTSNKQFSNIDVTTNYLHAKSGEITYSKLISVFKCRDMVTLKTLNGNIYNGVIDAITVNELYLFDSDCDASFFT